MNKTKTIGVSGAAGSFSEEAALHYCQTEKIKDFNIKYLVSVERVLKNIEQDKIDLGIFPIENSNGGIVYESVYAMAKHLFNIKKLFEIDIHHNLLTKPGIKGKDIRKIASHDQALKQCKMYLRRKWPQAEIIEWADTAKAARDLKEGKLPQDCAVIAPKKSAEIYGLNILEEAIQDLKFNFTTFLAIKNGLKKK